MSILKKGILQKVENGGGGTGTGILGEVNTFSDLPVSATTGDRYLVLTYSISTPTKLKGVYRWNGSSWDRQNGARAFDVVYDNSGSTLTSINLEASTNELDAKVNGKAASNDSRFDNHLSSFTQNSGQYIATEGVRARDVGGIALLNNSGTAGVSVADNGDVDIITKISATELKARNANGLKLHDDGGNGLFVEDGGNVGIGNTSPSEKLEVSGNLLIDSQLKIKRIGYRSGSHLAMKYYQYAYAGGGLYDTVQGALEFRAAQGWDTNDLVLTLYSEGFGNNYATIYNKLGIGKTPTDTAVLDIEGSETGGGGLCIRLKNTNTNTSNNGRSHATLVLEGNNGAVVAQYYADGFGGTAYLRTYTNHPISIGTNATERMRIENDGKVKINDSLGIGMSPTQYAALDMEKSVSSGSGAQINLKNTASGNSYAVLNLYGNNGGVAGQFYAGGGTATLRTFTNHGLIFGTNGTERMRITNSGSVSIIGSLSKGSGSFDIPHPDPEKKETHRLRHYFVETPSAGGNIYKYQIECEVGNNYIDLPNYYQYLNKDSLVWVSPVKHFGRAWGEVEDNRKVKIVAEEKGIYNILVFGDRKDETAIKDFNKFGIEYKNKK
jgi:hypothetical protein